MYALLLKLPTVKYPINNIFGLNLSFTHSMSLLVIYFPIACVMSCSTNTSHYCSLLNTWGVDLPTHTCRVPFGDLHSDVRQTQPSGPASGVWEERGGRAGGVRGKRGWSNLPQMLDWELGRREGSRIRGSGCWKRIASSIYGLKLKRVKNKLKQISKRNNFKCMVSLQMLWILGYQIEML